jgi:uncharacterized protein involved in outer membrane biogenesis
MLDTFKKRLSGLGRGRRDAAGAAGLFVRRRRHRLRHFVFGAVALLAVFTLVGVFVVPPVAKYYLVRVLSEQLERPVAIQDIAFNPFAMSARVKGFTVQERRSSQPFVSFDELLLTLEYRSLLRRAPVLNHITLVRPYVHIARNLDGRTYNFSDLLEKFSKPQPQPERPKSAPRFSLNNIQLVNGRIDFEDHPKHMRHTVSEIGVSIPFISNLPDVIDVYVQPAFAAQVNGTYVGLRGRTKPFKDTLETSIDLNIERLDLPRYVEYVPVKLGFELASGLLDLRLTASFVRTPGTEPQLLMRGDLGVEKLSLRSLDGSPLLNLAAVTVPVTGIDLLGRKAELGSIALTSPEVFVKRHKNGSVNWMDVRPKTDADAAATQPPEAGTAPAVAISVAELAIHDGVVHVDDQLPAKGFRTELSALQASLREFALPQHAPAQVDASFNTSAGETVKVGASVLIDPLSAEGNLELAKIRLKTYAPYYQALILYEIEDGVADLSTRYSFASGADGAKIRLSELNLGLASMRMRKPGQREDFLRAKSAQIRNAEVDVNRLALTVGQVTLRDGLLNLIRESDGTLNAARILPAPKGASAQGGEGSPWLISFARVDAEKWKIAFTDLAMKEPVKLVVDDIRLNASGLSNRKGVKAQVALQAKLNENGAIKLAGPLTINPIEAQLNVELERFGLVPLQPYFTDKVNVLLSSGEVSAKGAAGVARNADGAVSASFNGDITLADLASVDKANSEDLLKWKSLFLNGVHYQHAPMSLTIDQIALSDFYARIVVFAEGRLNLQNIAATGPAGTAADDEKTNPPAARGDAAANATPAPAPAGAGAAPPVKIGKVVLQGGDIAFTDLFVKPNYSADLSEIGGSVTGLSSQLDTTADVVLRGRFAKTAPVEISGKINPLVKDLFLDLKATVRDIELGPLTPYSGKYVGYAIEKGKMSFDVAYKIEHRKLTAANRLVLNQLTFGGRIESPQATKLPVLLAVSLLKDRNGVIDVNLPVSGSLDDPKFSIGGIVVRIIFNLIEKAVTAPFSLIANLVGGSGSEELSYVEFDYGRALPTAAGQEKLVKLQSALVERPGLKLDITGRVDPEKDREGLRHYRFEQQVKVQKLKEMVKQGSSVSSVDQISIDPQDYEKYLRLAYKDAKFAKPRNALGFTKDLPVAEMEKLMQTNTQVSDDDLVTLANQRAQLAKDAITKDGKVALERVYLLAPSLNAKGDDKLKASRVDFALK